MATLLSIDSSTKTLSLSLFENDRFVAEKVIPPSDKGHAEKLAGLLDQLLSENNIKLSQLTRLVVGAGPGSFTSLRVGWVSVLGLSQALGIKMEAYSSLMALSRDAIVKVGQVVIPVIKAGRGQVYAGFYLNQKALQDEVCLTPDELKNVLEEKFAKNDIVFVGPGCEILVEHAYFKDKNLHPAIAPHARHLGLIALEGASPSYSEIRYLKAPDLGGKSA